MMGAPIMSAEAALSAGAGLVVLAIPDSAGVLPHEIGAEIMTRYLASGPDAEFNEQALDTLRPELPSFGAVVLGPGLSRHDAPANLVRKLVSETDRPLVIDADGLSSFSGRVGMLADSTAPIVITPHHGEMARLLGIEREEVSNHTLDIARRTATDNRVMVVLKGAPTVIAFPDGRAWINHAGNPGMATAGSGDLLAGIIASLVAQTGSLQRGTLAGVYLHSLAGDVARDSSGERSLRARDMLAAVPSAYRRLEEIR